MTTAQPILSLRSVRKMFGPHAADDSIDLDIAEGEFFTIVGPSGSGKTTILRMLAGMDTPTSGDIMLKGGPAPKRDFFYWEQHEGRPLQAVRFGDWKAVRNGPSAAIELYDLKGDSGETTDVAKTHPDLVARAEKLMREARVDDPNWPLVEPKAKARAAKGAGR